MLFAHFDEHGVACIINPHWPAVEVGTQDVVTPYTTVQGILATSTGQKVVTVPAFNEVAVDVAIQRIISTLAFHVEGVGGLGELGHDEVFRIGLRLTC